MTVALPISNLPRCAEKKIDRQPNQAARAATRSHRIFKHLPDSMRARSPGSSPRWAPRAGPDSLGADGTQSPGSAPQGRTSFHLETDLLLPQVSEANGGPPSDKDQDEPIDWSTSSILFLFPAIGGLLFGYDIGSTSGALVSLTNASHSATSWGPSLTPFQSGLVVSLSLAGALAGSAAALVKGDALGRRRELLLAAGLYGGRKTKIGCSYFLFFVSYFLFCLAFRLCCLLVFVVPG
jgi:hypothetical protein